MLRKREQDSQSSHDMIREMMVTFLLACCVALAAHGAAPLDSVVASHYPHFLSEQAALHRYDDHRQQTYVELSARGIGYVVAAYSNGEAGGLVLLEMTSDGYRVDSEITREFGPIIEGRNPKLETLDVDGDGIPEIIARFDDSFRRSPHSWVFRVANGHLRLISPTEESGWPVLGLPKFLDLNGNGTRDMIDNVVVSRELDDVKIEQAHYALRDGMYVELEPVDDYEMFFTDEAKPVTKKFSVSGAAVRRMTKLVIVNGDELGAPYAVSSGTVTLNGKAISVGPGTRVVRVKLRRDNLLSVSLRGGKHGSRVGVVIRHD